MPESPHFLPGLPLGIPPQSKSIITRLEGDIEKLLSASNYVRFAGCTCPNLSDISNLASDKIYEIILDLAIVTKTLDGVLAALQGGIVQ